jgi:hypothetical protein
LFAALDLAFMGAARPVASAQQLQWEW